MTKNNDGQQETILFSGTTKRLFKEINQKHREEINSILIDVYKENNLWDRIKSGNEVSKLLGNFEGVQILKKGNISQEKTDPTPEEIMKDKPKEVPEIIKPKNVPEIIEPKNELKN